MKKIFILNNKGGCGKSTLTMSLADVLKGEVVDLDSQTELSELKAFQDVLTEPLGGKALRQVEQLVQEVFKIKIN